LAIDDYAVVHKTAAQRNVKMGL